MTEWKSTATHKPPKDKPFLGYILGEHVAFACLGRTGDPNIGAGNDLAYFISYTPSEDAWAIEPEDLEEFIPLWAELPTPKDSK